MISEEIKSTFLLLSKISSGAIAASGPRYTEIAHVDLEIKEVFDGLVRHERFKNRILQAKGEIFRAFLSIDDLGYFEQEKNLAAKFLHLKEMIKFFNISLGKLKYDPSFDPKPICIPELADEIRNLSEQLQSDLYSYVPNNRKEFNPSHGFKNESERFIYYFRKFTSKVYEVLDLVNSDAFKAYCNSTVWITSAAGFGKTHLLCDFSSAAMSGGLPVLFLLGQQIPDQDIWITLCRKLKIDLKSHENAQRDFLDFANKVALITNKKFIIIVDALNEGIGKEYWPQRVNELRKVINENPNLGMVVSCRSTYEHLIKPAAEWQIVEHKGFEKNIFIATQRFFNSYGIVGHEIPLLGEFKNPLFLKTYCEALKDEDARILRGHVGIKWVHEQYFKKIDTKIAKRLGYQQGQLTTHLFAKRVALLMAQSGNEWISFETFSKAVADFQKAFAIVGDFQFELLNEGLFARDFFYDYHSKTNVESIRFGFQKFSDIFIAREILTIANLTSINMVSDFNRSAGIKSIFDKAYRNQSIIEALASLVPEYTTGSIELIELMPDIPEALLFDATLDSLIWRELGAYPRIDKLRKVLGPIINTEDRYRRFLDTILSVSTTPFHPLNSKFLFLHLSRKSMPIRDSEWLPYLHFAYEDGAVVTRIIDWAWSIDFKSVSHESLKLYAQTLCWFFASSHRFIRDRATKAMVLLLTHHPQFALGLTKMFNSIDDDYIFERIIVASYGAFARNKNSKVLFKYADYIYDYYFLAKNLRTNISIRFYSKRLIILAKELGWKRKINSKKIKPPFKSVWPKKISTAEEVKSRYKSTSWDSMKPEWGYDSIYSSVMDWGDFARYEIGTDRESPWVSKKFIPANKQKSKFRKSLRTDEEKETFDLLERGLKHDFALDAKFEKLLNDVENSFFCELLGDQKFIWTREIKPILKNKKEELDRLPYSTIQHMIMDRIDLMYSTKLHGRFDRYMSHGDTGRAPDKPERIGKKYQWISFFNVIGIVSDRYNYYGYDFITDDPGIEQTSFVKHIDPTIAIRSYLDVPDIASIKQIEFPKIVDWKPELDNVNWLKDRTDFFEAKKLICQKDCDGREWLLFDGGHSFQEETPPDEEKYSSQRRDVFYVINSYVFRKSDEHKVLKFLEKVDYANRWMPESHNQIDPHYAEFSLKAFRAEMPNEKLCEERYRGVPFKFSLTTEQYLYEQGTHDCSMEETMNIMMPSYPLLVQMNIEGKNFDGLFKLKDSEELVAFNIKERPAHGFLFRKDILDAFLRKENLGIFWSVLSEKRMLGGNRQDSAGRHDLSSTLVYIDGEFREVGRQMKFHNYKD